MIDYNATKNDAGLFREYIVIRYGATLVHGGSAEQRRTARVMIIRLAGMIGKSVAQVTRDIIADYEAI